MIQLFFEELEYLISELENIRSRFKVECKRYWWLDSCRKPIVRIHLFKVERGKLKGVITSGLLDLNSALIFLVDNVKKALSLSSADFARAFRFIKEDSDVIFKIISYIRDVDNILFKASFFKRYSEFTLRYKGEYRRISFLIERLISGVIDSFIYDPLEWHARRELFIRMLRKIERELLFIQPILLDIKTDKIILSSDGAYFVSRYENIGGRLRIYKDDIVDIRAYSNGSRVKVGYDESSDQYIIESMGGDLVVLMRKEIYEKVNNIFCLRIVERKEYDIEVEDDVESFVYSGVGKYGKFLHLEWSSEPYITVSREIILEQKGAVKRAEVIFPLVSEDIRQKIIDEEINYDYTVEKTTYGNRYARVVIDELGNNPGVLILSQKISYLNGSINL